MLIYICTLYTYDLICTYIFFSTYITLYTYLGCGPLKDYSIFVRGIPMNLHLPLLLAGYQAQDNI